MHTIGKIWDFKNNVIFELFLMRRYSRWSIEGDVPIWKKRWSLG
jgi:hypothetical protein